MILMILNVSDVIQASSARMMIKQRPKDRLQMRGSIHTGSVIAGVQVNLTKPLRIDLDRGFSKVVLLYFVSTFLHIELWELTHCSLVTMDLQLLFKVSSN